jgi:8-oxo-dGTP pyrophosphatase MutT (NUDIX family)
MVGHVVDPDPLRGDLAAEFPVPMAYALSAVVYVERDDEILLLHRAEGTALAGQWFLPGGLVEAGELPEDAARRELREETGLVIDGELELVGCYPMFVYGYDVLQLSFRGAVAEGETVEVSEEHHGWRWVRAAEMRALLTDEVLDGIAGGDERIGSLLRHVRTDLDRYLRRAGAGDS